MRAYRIVAPDLPERGGDGADALVLDGRAIAMEAVGASRRQTGGPRMFIRVDRIEALDSETLAGLVALRPDAFVLPAAHGRDVAHLGALLAVDEAERGLPDGGIDIVALVVCAAGVLEAKSFVTASRRLRALGWDAAALAKDLGAEPLVADGWSPVLAQARVLVRLAAAAAGVEAIEAAYPGEDAEHVQAAVAAARRDGFGAMFARDAAQVRHIRAEA